MIVHHDGSVYLNRWERRVKIEFDRLLDAGATVTGAVGTLRSANPELGPKFWNWLLGIR